MSDSIFTKIINRELPSTIRYEDDEFIAFDDITPSAPVHVLVVPKKPYQTLEDVEIQDTLFMGKLLRVCRIVAQDMGIKENYRLAMNIGSELQAVMHIHVHVVGGWKSTEKIKQRLFPRED